MRKISASGPLLVLIMAVSLLIFNACTSSKDQTMDKKINITGKAQNAKAGAVVVTADSSVYYIDGMSSWADDVVNTNVTVSGELYTLEHKAEDLVNEKGEYSQGMVGTQKIIKMAIVQKK